MEDATTDTDSGPQTRLATIENIPSLSCGSAQFIARARAQLASRMIDNQSTPTRLPRSTVQPDDIRHSTDNGVGTKASEELIGNNDSIFAPERLETQLPDCRGAFHAQGYESLFCPPGPFENIWRPNYADEPSTHLALSGNLAMDEQGEQSDFESSIPPADGPIETIRKRKRTLLSQFTLNEAAPHGPVTICKPGAKGKSSQSRKGNGGNSKRKSKSAPKYWQKNTPALSNLGTWNGIEHAKSNAGKQAIPSFSTKNKDKATKEIVNTVPAENLKEAISDRQLILKSSCKFTMKPKADGQGGWLHPNLITSLFHFQLIGVGFMRDCEKSETPPFGGFQCDEMGFGKTVQLIANIVDDQEACQGTDNVTLVVAPSHLAKHWKDQFVRHCKQKVLQPVLEYHARSKPSTTDDVEFFKGCRVIITTYAQVRASLPKFEPPAEVVQEREINALRRQFVEEKGGPLHRINFRRIILDEAHEIKNKDTQTSVAVRMLSGHFRWVVTGTPLHKYGNIESSILVQVLITLP
ncbi:hypothetical protein ACJ72_01644 [Emergomyces africanus]|uniref:Helicase ATP-binding domain-containing protein n=1 Tax=Emergomyces africanus TaxID=1955775 RepID=A0A1B7P4P3_9EURO|nr:hypothetical protein ACJ72_01644 [Emergomyces africanus]